MFAWHGEIDAERRSRYATSSRGVQDDEVCEPQHQPWLSSAFCHVQCGQESVAMSSAWDTASVAEDVQSRPSMGLFKNGDGADSDFMHASANEADFNDWCAFDEVDFNGAGTSPVAFSDDGREGSPPPFSDDMSERHSFDDRRNHFRFDFTKSPERPKRRARRPRKPTGQAKVDTSNEETTGAMQYDMNRPVATAKDFCTKYECPRLSTVSQCYRMRAKDLHPDKNGGSADMFVVLKRDYDSVAANGGSEVKLV